ncbi:MAG: T9SS type A sorting domain-containing protein [Crocinitomicaceae bacterium]
MSLKLVGAAAIVGISAAVYSFTSENEPDGPEFKKIEVIRMVDGEVTTFDTIVDVKSDYSPEAYLADLGFEKDENINIINLLDMHIPHIEMHSDGEEIKMGHGEKMIFIEMNEDHEVKGDNGERIIEKKMIITDENGLQIEKEMDGESQEIRIEKKVVKSSKNGDEDISIEIDVEGILEQINIDSIIASALDGKEGENGPVVMQKVIVIDDEHDGEMEDIKMEFHEMNTEDADYHKKIEGPNHKMEVAVWNEGGQSENFTLVIVSDPAMSAEKNTAKIENDKKVQSLKLFPNPASESTQLQLNFEDKAPTVIRVTDVNGKIVAVMELGNFSGKYNHEFNVRKWSKGVYMVHVEHGNTKVIEKLIVE